jgi:hypothetical protein
VKRDRMAVRLGLTAGVMLLLIGIVYFTVAAGSLPRFVPGHEAGSTHYHVKHGIAAVLLGAGAFVLVWFRLGPRPGRSG